MGAESPWRRVLLRLLLAGAACWSAGAACAAEELPEYRLKAAFVYNFAAFTEWPAEVGPNLVVCLFGGDPFGAEIDPLQGKKAGDRSLAVQRRSGIDTLKTCQVVYIAPSAMGQLPRVLDALRGLPVLTVADSPGAMRLGVALNMSLTQGRISFEANLAAARQAKLNLSSKLLRLASEVAQ